MINNANSLIIGQYINQRISNHIQLYQEQIQTFDKGKYSDTVWRIFYLTAHRFFINGHTLFWCDDNKIIKSSFFDVAQPMTDGGIELSSWQFLVIDMLYQELDSVIKSLEKQEPLSMDWLNDDLLLLYQIGDEHFFVTKSKELVNKSNHYIKEMIVQKNYQDILLILVRDFYYFLYLIKFQLLSLKDWYDNLLSQYFVSTMDDIDNIYDKPLILSVFDNGFGIWLNKSFVAELGFSRQLIKFLDNKKTADVDVDLLNPLLNAEQKNAILFALSHNFAIITGGPGTGKTFTVAQLVIMLAKMSDEPPILALTAPTGKAAQRMQESLANALVGAGVVMDLPTAKTIHRLIGLGVGGVPRHNATNPIIADVVVVDEASMLDTKLAYQLFAAISPETKLVLLGDVNQLAAVGAGKVLADLCSLPQLAHYHQKLVKSQRFDKDSGVGRLADWVNNANLVTVFDEFLTIITSDKRLDFVSLDWRTKSLHYTQKLAMFERLYDELAQGFGAYWAVCESHLIGDKATDEQTVDELFLALAQYRILTATHNGMLGDDKLNDEMTARQLTRYQQLKKRYKNLRQYRQKDGEWYHGRPVMVVQNHYELGLFNGDVGICVSQKTNDGYNFVVYFENKAPIPIALLSQAGLVVSAYAMTVHKSQGSEFDKVAICLEGGRELLGRELFYTAITRAKQAVLVVGDESALMYSVKHRVIRQTGLGFLMNWTMDKALYLNG